METHWDQIAGTDFFTMEVWTATGLKTFYILFMIELGTRRVHLAGITRHPNDMCMGYATERAAAFSRGALRSHDQGRVPGSDDSLRREAPSPSRRRVSGSFQSRTKPPGHRQRADRLSTFRGRRARRVHRATWWTPQVLPTRGVKHAERQRGDGGDVSVLEHVLDIGRIASVRRAANCRLGTSRRSARYLHTSASSEGWHVQWELVPRRKESESL